MVIDYDSRVTIQFLPFLVGANPLNEEFRSSLMFKIFVGKGKDVTVYRIMPNMLHRIRLNEG
jgi:hypothetical protein